MVNGEKWSEVDSLYGKQPTAPVFTARQADDGTTTLQFGNGITGALLPSGRGNIIATYRQGAGLEGRLKANQLNILLDRPVGLQSVTNPAETEGGADPQSLDQARQAAPGTVKTFDRAISLLDFESLARASGQVAKVKATWVWRGLEKAVHLTVAGQGGGMFSDEALSTLHSALTLQRDPNHTLLLSNFCRVPIVVDAKIQVNDRFVREDVSKAARRALVAFFSFDRVEFAKPVHLSDIYRVLQEVTGVISVDIDTLHFKGYTGWEDEQLTARGATSEPTQGHLRIFAARPGPASSTDPVVSACFGTMLPEVFPAEQAYIQTEASDLTLTATGGLE
jgi:predicted phage baseplate assembly protein